MSFEFLSSADMLGKIFWVCALGGTVFFVIRTIMMFIGADLDVDVDGLEGDFDVDTHSDAAFSIISINTLTAFIMMFGWGGLAAYIQYGLGHAISILIATVTGIVAMSIIAMLFRMAGKLTSKGSQFNIESTIGLNASVYQRIPGDGRGKVNVSMPGGILRELEALSEDKVDIDSFKTVKVVKVIDNKTISVRLT